MTAITELVEAADPVRDDEGHDGTTRLAKFARGGKDGLSFWIEDSRLRRRVGRGWPGGCLLVGGRVLCANGPVHRLPRRWIVPDRPIVPISCLSRDHCCIF